MEFFLKTIFEFLKARYPVLLLVALAILITAYLVWKFCQVYYKRFMPLETKCSNLEDKHGEMTANVGKIAESVGKIHTSTKLIATYLISKDSTITAGLFETASPLTLSGLGGEILNASGGKLLIDQNIDYLIEKIHSEEFKTALDVQNAAISTIVEEYNSDKFIPIKNFMFNNPKFKDVMINLSTISFIMGLYLRDKYFDKYPQLKDIEPEPVKEK